MQIIGYKEKRKVLKDFYKGKSLALKILIDFQELTLHESVNVSSFYLWYYKVIDNACVKRTRKIGTSKSM